MDSKPLRVTVRRAPGGSPNELLEEVLEASGFWGTIDAVCREHQIAPAHLKIVIKPDLDVYDLAIPAGTDPALVDHLAALLHDREFKSITVIDGRNSQDHWLLNREPQMVADLVGYDFSGKFYTVAGGADSLSSAETWVDAHFRINFAKNRTHESQVYALCVHNLLGVNPQAQAHNDLGGRCLNVLRGSPPHFNLIDGFVSCHGAAGERAPKMLKTCTLLASTDTLLADIAGASKMGLDPYASVVAAKCLRAQGLPGCYEVDGDLAPYPMWQNVHPLVADSARRRNEVVGLGAVAAGWFQTVDRENFPFREFYNDRANSFIAPMMGRIDEDARAQWIVLTLNYLIINIGNAILAQNTLFAKSKLQQQTKSLEIDLDDYDASDYTGLPEYLAPFEQMTFDAPQIADNMRIRRLDGATLFWGAYEFPFEYDEFVDRVKIERSIQYMNDYIGGSTVAVASDDTGHIHMQAERNLYLQQPNWMILVGGDMIDVEKLELIVHENDKRSIFWRTVASPNGSAESDDGRVSFTRASNGCTRMEIFTRQKFTLPLFFQVAHIDLFPGIRDPIIESGYQRFFEHTVANMQAEFEGQGYRIGQEPPSIDHFVASGLSDLGRYLATGLATLSELLRHKGDFAGFDEWFSVRSWASPPATLPTQDADGFRHFGPTALGSRYDRTGHEVSDYFKQLEDVAMDAPGFLAGLATAVQRDLELFAENNSTDSST